jgi:hypothetical protein
MASRAKSSRMTDQEIDGDELAELGLVTLGEARVRDALEHRVWRELRA